MKTADRLTPCQIISGSAQRLDARHLAESADGLARFPWFPLGKPEMDEQDWRQFEITLENARRMVDEGNADIAAGAEIWVNYGHDGSGPRAGDVVRFELGDDGAVIGVVRWNEKAKAALRLTPPEWKYFSPEFFAAEVLDEKGERVFEGGRLLLRPFHIAGGAVVNTPAMKKLALAAHVSRGEPGSGRSHTPAPVGSTPTTGTTPQNHSPQQASRKEEPMKLPKTLKALGLADGASDEAIDNAVMAALEERDALKASTARPDVKALVREEMAAERESIRAEVKAELEKESAKKARETRAAALVKRLETAGKLVADNRDVLTKLAASDPDALEKLEPTLPVLASVAPVISGQPTEPAASESAALDAAARELQKASQAAGKPMTYSQAVIAASAKKVA